MENPELGVKPLVGTARLLSKFMQGFENWNLCFYLNSGLLSGSEGLRIICSSFV